MDQRARTSPGPAAVLRDLDPVITHAEAPDRGSAMVTDWLNPIASAFPDQADPASSTLIIAVIRPLLLDRLASAEPERTEWTCRRPRPLLSPSDSLFQAADRDSASMHRYD